MLLKPSDLELQSSERYEEWGTEDKACSLFPRWRDQPRVPATKEGPRAPRPGLGEHGAHPPLPQSSSHHSPPPPPSGITTLLASTHSPFCSQPCASYLSLYSLNSCFPRRVFPHFQVRLHVPSCHPLV